ncbi:MAG: PilZ domain-containing protein [Gammaproteobacteria bacterium]
MQHTAATQTRTFDESVYALIVTDSPLTRQYVTAILREIIDLGHVHSLDNREAALQHIEANSPQHCSFIFYEDALVTDSHHAFIESIRQQTATASTPIVVLGQAPPHGHDPEHARQQLSTFLQRPFVPSALISLLFELFQEKDRRLATRINTGKLPCTVDMGYYATQPYAGQLLNISYTGCLLQTRHALDDCGGIDDIGSIRFQTAEGVAIHLSGKIVRADAGDDNQIGFQFQNNEEDDLVRLGCMISALSKPA